MKIQSIVKNLETKFQLKNFSLLKRGKKIRISDLDSNSQIVSIDQVGVSSLGEGVVILKTEGGMTFPISSFSIDTAKNILDFKEGNLNQLPSLYHMLETICETLGLILVKVRIYKSGDALRANLYFTGKKDFILRNYRASDAIALAAFYHIPILVKQDLLDPGPKMELK